MQGLVPRIETALVARESRALEKTFVDNPAEWLIQMFGGRASTTGMLVNETTAMSSPAFFAATVAIANTMGSLPLQVFRRLEGGKEADPDHSLYETLHLAPNPEITTMLWRQMKQAHLILHGNAYSEKVTDGAGHIRELWPIHPQRMRVERASGQLVYIVSVPGGSVSGPGQPVRRAQEVRLPPEQMLHIRGISLDGVLGLSRLLLHRESIGLGLTLEQYAGLFFGHGARPGGNLEHPGKLSEPAHKRLRESWEQMHGGLGNAHRVAILEEGMKFHENTVEHEKAQMLQSRQFQIGETARLAGTPGVMIGHDDKTATYASAEQFFLSYTVHTVRPWAVQWDQALTFYLLTPRERKTHFIEHNLDGLLRGDALGRAQSLQIQLQNGAINVDEWRAIENRNPLPNGLGKKHFIPLNMQLLEQAGQPKPEPIPDPEPEPEPEPRRMVHLLGHYVAAAAKRALHREVEAIRKAGSTYAANPAEWRKWVDEFYGRHAGYLAESLHVSLDEARTYTTDHRAQLLAEGLSVVESWNGGAETALMALALHERGVSP